MIYKVFGNYKMEKKPPVVGAEKSSGVFPGRHRFLVSISRGLLDTDVDVDIDINDTFRNLLNGRNQPTPPN